MAALEALLLEPTDLDDGLADLIDPADPDLVDPTTMQDAIDEQNLVLARVREVPDTVRMFVEGLADDVATLPLDAALRTDPYLLVALQQALLAALRALDNSDLRAARSALRVHLEQLRQVYRDLADARPIFEGRPVTELARWLAEALQVPQARLADLLGVSSRTFQRWLSPADSSEPVGDDARRVRVVANLVGHLRHALTGQGVLEWFDTPHPLAENRTPADLLDEPDALPQLTRLAASTRSSIAA